MHRLGSEDPHQQHWKSFFLINQMQVLNVSILIILKEEQVTTHKLYGMYKQ